MTILGIIMSPPLNFFMGVSSMCIFRLYYFSNGWFNYGIYNKIVMRILALEMPVALKLIIKLISFGSKYLIQRN